MTFHVGQKVVCVDAEDTHRDLRRELTKGAVYEICQIMRYDDFRITTGRYLESPVGVRLSGVIRSKHNPPFAIERFRPLIERKTEISIFTKMLTGKRVRESAC